MTPQATPDMIIGCGTFAPGRGHMLRGTFTLTRTADGILMETSRDFFFDGALEPSIGLHTAIPFSEGDPVLKRNMIATRFVNLPGGDMPALGRYAGFLPGDTDFDVFNTLVLWCHETPFILGIGPIEPVDRVRALQMAL